MNLKIIGNNLLLITASIGSVLLPTVSSATSGSLRGLEKKEDTFDCTLLIKLTKFDDDSEHQDLECEVDQGSIYAFEEVPKGLQDKFKAGSIDSNFDKLQVAGKKNVEIRNKKLVIQPGAATSIIKGNKKDVEDKKRSLQTGPPKNTLALWVQAADASTSTPMDNGNSNCLTDEIFGTYGDINNLKTKYDECSYGKTTFNPFGGTTSTGATVSNGVYSVTVSESAGGVDNSIIRNAATNAATTALGSLSQFDHVMVCVPPGTSGGWIAYAYINSLLSVYNDQWCTYLSAQMHEMGHNLGLAHSGETATYDDQSGMMGYSYSSDDGPNMCFNAPKSWQLGWYADKSLQLDSGNYNWSGKIYGIDDYGSSMNNDGFITIRLASALTDDIYVSFNKQNGINSGTAEGGNQVLIHSRSGSTTSEYSASVLLAKLNAGGTYVASIDGGSVPITVISLTTGDTGFAQVQIGSVTPTLVPTSIPTTSPTNSPTQGPTNPLTSAPTKAPVTDTPTSSPTTSSPTLSPTMVPTGLPTKSPTSFPTTSPTNSPTAAPTNIPVCSSITRGKICKRTQGCVWKRRRCRVA